MARVTIEDCLPHVENIFQLVLLASKRARQLAVGSVQPTVDWEGDKVTVVALREIAEGNITQDYLNDKPKAEEPISEQLLAEQQLPPPTTDDNQIPL